MVIGDILAINAINFPKKTALIMDGERFAYAQMNAESNRMANALIAHGVEEGIRVAVLEKTTLPYRRICYGDSRFFNEQYPHS